MAIARADDWVVKWAEALGIEPSETRRIIIDAEAGSALRVYVEKLGTTKMYDIEIPDLSETEIHILE